MELDHIKANHTAPFGASIPSPGDIPSRQNPRSPLVNHRFWLTSTATSFTRLLEPITPPNMLSRRAFNLAARSTRAFPRSPPQPLLQRAPFSSAVSRRAQEEIDDPEMNNNYINPPRIKRQHRDPYADWDDKQERRNFGEPVHEDNEVLGIFALEDYTHMTPARGALLWAGFISAILAVSYAVSLTYPGKPSVPTEYPGGLDKELGGPGATRAFQAGDKYEE